MHKKHTITLLDSNFQEKSITLTHEQLLTLNDWLNVYLKNSVPLKYQQVKTHYLPSKQIYNLEL
jgi:hypothetical protein